MLDLTGKVAIVTGAGSVGPGWGNGKATATLLARQKASVFLIDIKPDAAAETHEIIAGEGGNSAVHVCNMLDAAAVQEMVQACLDRFKRIDILVNNVGGSEPGDPVTLSEEAWDRQIDFNLKTAFLGCKYVIPVMQAQWARDGSKAAIVNIASVAGMRNDPGGRVHVGYSASKAGVIQFSKSTAAAFAKQGIRCNTVVPGLMHTPLVEYRLARQIGGNDAAALIAKRNARPPLGHMGTGWDVAHAVLFLASDEAGYITGTEIVVDGGLTTMAP
jgi:NAD(P)-dependent dehydrogenase (short-subunit alcohol dehydrogenase family)